MPPASQAFAGRLSESMRAAAAAGIDDVYRLLGTRPAGLTSGEAAIRRRRHGENRLPEPAGRTPGRAVLSAAANPLVVLLASLATTSFVAGDDATAAMMLVILAASVGIRVIQERRADAAARGLRALVRVRATVIRDAEAGEIPVAAIVPGDVVLLAAGDMVPADVRLVAAKDLFVSQAVLTGESFPVEKGATGPLPAGRPLDLPQLCFRGSSVETGSATAVVVETGRDTLLGGLAATLERPRPASPFQAGLARFTWSMVGLVAVMAPLVFLVNGLTKGDWWNAFLFSLAAGVGLAPEMLPMIVAVCLARGGLDMAARRVIVKRPEAIEDLGAMDLLCTDKTGTLTCDRIVLERHRDVLLRDDPEVLAMAWLNAHFQTGLRNVLDRAILDHDHLRDHVVAGRVTKVDEVPFDFGRRMMSVVVDRPAGRRLICKGAVEAVLARCTACEVDGGVRPLDPPTCGAVQAEWARLGGEGFRVLAVAYADVPWRPAYSRDDERDLVLRGYLAFFDPPKDSAGDAVAALAEAGVAVKVLTGDNELVGRSVCRAVGLRVGDVLLGESIDGLDDPTLTAAAERALLLARLAPAQKERIVRLLRRAGHVVGFLGDGVNDAPALRAADVGITVDSAVDLAREQASCILLDKDLRVLHEGVLEGRRVFANILKYVRMGASSNFGNMLSLLGASILLPFLPLTPLQVLVNNLLYDCSQVPIPGDEVDPELVARPRHWAVTDVARYVLLIGPLSSVFDLTTFAVMQAAFGWTGPDGIALFRTGWFVESLLTQTLIIHVIRTDRVPFLGSRSSGPLAATTAAVMLAGAWLPDSPLGPAFGFAPLPWFYWPFLLGTLLAYAALVHVAHRSLRRRGLI